jgi:alanine-glyoxylate transaminase/serine-glyoxylate transaminase/serine-pyruvate transaminase
MRNDSLRGNRPQYNSRIPALQENKRLRRKESMLQHVKLFTPSPGDVDEEVLLAMGQPAIRYYGPEWLEIFNETLSLTKQIFRTQHDLFIVPGPASALLEMATGSLVKTGDKMIVGCNGFFGERLYDIASGYGITIVRFTAPLGKPLEPELLRKLLRENPAVQVVALVHHETGTTVLNPLRELAGVVREAGKLIIVDTVASMGGAEVAVDDWGIDICVTTANKCLEAMPGIGLISISPRAWELVDDQPDLQHGWYLNLKTWRRYAREWGDWHPTPVTMPVNNILAVRASMHTILRRGLAAQFARYTHASQVVRLGLANLGFEMFVPEAYASTVVTGVKARPEFEVAEFGHWLVEQRNIAVGGGLGELAGKIFRVGHLGKATEREYLVDFLFSVEEFLRFKGFKVPVGASLVGM